MNHLAQIIADPEYGVILKEEYTSFRRKIKELDKDKDRRYYIYTLSFEELDIL